MTHQPVQAIQWNETIPPVLAPPIVTPGESRWHCLIVYPQREAPTRIWLAEHGVEAFYPVTITKQRHRGRDISRVRRYLPGYVFANFPGEPAWWRILGDARRNVRDVLRVHNGEAGRLHEDTLTQLQAMREVDEELEERKRVARTVRKGDLVRIKVGELVNWEVEIVDIKGPKGVFHVKLFGAEHSAEVDLANVEKLA
jgi:transcription antitermination factor NusG